jgi:PRTRC genetic system ThiF family protein
MAVKRKRSLEKSYGFVLDDFEISRLTKVFVIGCGGNGSHLVSDLARLVGTLDLDIEIVLIDGDSVEEKNLIRQHFIGADLGKNKAQVLASRYASAYNASMGHVPEYLTNENKGRIFGQIGTPQLIITCTDNLKSRKLVSKQTGQLWLDLGNEEIGGQVTFSSLMRPSTTDAICSGAAWPIPHVFELFPEFDKRVDSEKEVDQLSCAELAEESPSQAGYVNVICAAIAKNYLHALLTQRPIKTFQTFFTIDNTFESRSITRSVIEGWIEKYPRFQKCRV